MKLSIFCWRDADSIQPGEIVATGDRPDHPLHVNEVRTTVDRVELYGHRNPEAEDQRRSRLTFAMAEPVMVLPRAEVAVKLWGRVREATAAQVSDAVAMPGPLAGDDAHEPPVRPGDTEDTILVTHRGRVWLVMIHPEPDAPAEPDDQGA